MSSWIKIKSIQLGQYNLIAELTQHFLLTLTNFFSPTFRWWDRPPVHLRFCDTYCVRWRSGRTGPLLPGWRHAPTCAFARQPARLWPQHHCDPGEWQTTIRGHRWVLEDMQCQSHWRHCVILTAWICALCIIILTVQTKHWKLRVIHKYTYYAFCIV